MSTNDSESSWEWYREEYLYSLQEEYVYTACEIPDTSVEEESCVEEDNFPKCDVFQIFPNKWTMNVSVAYNKLQQHIQRSESGPVYAVRIETTDDFDAPVTGTRPLDCITAWTSKGAYDKWHMINDEILQNDKISHPINNQSGIDNGMVASHYNVVYRFDSVVLRQFEPSNNECKYVRFDIAKKHQRIIPKTKMSFGGGDVDGIKALIDIQKFMQQSVVDRPHRIMYIFQPEKIVSI
jgi:hypothetical protein